MSSKQGKVWGTTTTVKSTSNFSLHRLFVKTGGVCSKHKHDFKFNGFFVEKGKLLIRIWKNDYNLIDETILTSRDYTEAAPQEYHQFEALEDTVCYEFYFQKPLAEDIVRENHGSVNNKSQAYFNGKVGQAAVSYA